MADTLSKRRIGAYGGTFDPLHNGHIEIARAVFRIFKLDQLLIIPAHKPPHKNHRSISDAYHRYAMAVLATIEEPGIVVSTVELDAPERPYTVETLDRLRGLYGEQAQLFFLMGADSFEEINTWREPEKLLSMTNVIVAARPGYEIATSHLDEAFRSRIVDRRGQSEQVEGEEQQSCCYIYLTDYVSHDVSSTEIRQRVEEGRSISGLVPPSVADYIEKYGLYRR